MSEAQTIEHDAPHESARAIAERKPQRPLDMEPAQPITPMGMIDRALALNAAPETLERLFALQERYEANQARRAFEHHRMDLSMRGEERHAGRQAVSRDIGTTPRKPLSRMQRLKLFEDHRGVCGLCGLTIRAGERWRDEHLRPLGLGGGNELSNRAPVHERCADAKNADDLPRIAKAKRQKAAYLGIKPKSRGFATNRGGRLKKKLDGSVVLR